MNLSIIFSTFIDSFKLSKMKNYTYSLIFLMFLSVNIFAQTHTSIPYLQNFDGETTTSLVVSDEWRFAGENDTIYTNNLNTPLGTHSLTMSALVNNTANDDSSLLHLDLSGESQVDFSFYWKNYGNPDNATGVYFSDDGGASYIFVQKLFSATANAPWQPIDLDLDKIASDSGLNLTSNFIILFRQIGAKSLGSSPYSSSDGIAIDSIHVREGLPLTSGEIGFADTICGGSAASISIFNVTSPENGNNVYSYTWQTSSDLSTWSNYAAPDLDTLTMAGPITQSVWVRRGVESPVGTGGTGEGIIYTNPILVVIPDKTPVIIFGLGSQYCSNEDSVLLSTFPPGGALVDNTMGGGSALNGNYFVPEDAVDDSLGTLNTLIYTFTDSYNCTYADTATTTVYTSPAVNFAAVGSYPETQTNPVILDGFITADRPGTYVISGDGVALDGSNDYIFTPSASGGPGVKTLTCTFTSASNQGGCVVEVTSDAYVTGTSSGTIFTDNEHCTNGIVVNATYPTPGPPAFNAPFFYCGGAAPTLHAQSIYGAGIQNNSNNYAEFNPALAGAGVHVITYEYTYRWDYDQFNFSTWNCQPSFYYDTRYVFQTITVYEEPDIRASLSDTSYCEYETAQSIVSERYNSGTATWSLITPTNYYLDGVAHGSNFNPSIEGPGTYDISIRFAENACVTFDTAQVVVDTTPIVLFTGIADTYCLSDPQVNININPLGGVFSGINSASIASDSLIFYPDRVSGAGAYTISYAYEDSNGCSATASLNTELFGAPNLSISGLNATQQYCVDDSLIALQGQESGVNFSGGTFFGPGITDGGGNGTATLNPYTVPGDSTYYIGYTYTNTNGCIDSVLEAVEVSELPVVDFFQLDSQYCESATLVELSATQGTGTFSGEGILSGTFFFNPQNVTTLSTPINITFQFIDSDTKCGNSVTKTTVVDTLPVVEFTGLEAEYCEDAPVDTLFGTQPNGTFEGMFNNDTIGDIVGLDVNNEFDKGFYTITYSYTDVNNCFNADTQTFRVHPLPEPSFIGLDNQSGGVYCENENIYGLIGSVNANHPNNFFDAYFYGQYGPGDIDSTGITSANFDPKQVPILTPGGETNDTISFVYIDDKGCRDTVSQVAEVHGLPVITVGITDSTLCTGDGIATLNITQPSGGGIQTFTVLEKNGILNSNTVDLDGSNVVVGLNHIVYEFEDQFNCTNYDTMTLTIYPEPEVDFILGSFCNNDSISFYDSSDIVPFDSVIYGINDDIITDWYWTFGDGGNSTLQNPKHQYIIPRDYPVELTVLTREGCEASFDSLYLVGEPPKAAFEWDNPCFGENMQFTDYSTFQLVDTITSWNWFFNDNGATSTLQNPTHEFSVQNSYDVMLALETGSGCIDTLVQTVNIRPVVDQYPYYESFENGDGGWFAGGVIDTLLNASSWELGVANARVINDSISGNISWVTDLDNDHANNEQSFVDGPCFDFTNLVRPMIVMDVWADMLEGSDGAALQYSLDTANTWVTIGEIGDGINWYNKTSISGNPGSQAINQVGWSYQDSNWVEVRHDLDTLAGEPQVRLRIAFGSDANSANGGFAFDNIEIRERERITLIEYFTNSSDVNSRQNDDYIDGVIRENRKDVVDIQYHTEFPGSDEMNSHNPSDPSARSLFYGAFNVGRGVLNGNAYNGISSEITTNMIKLQMLKDSPYTLIVGEEDDGTDITATAYLVAREDIDTADLTLHIAVIENEITAITGSNGDTQFMGVLKKMLPSATGTLIQRSFALDDTVGVEEVWTMANVFDVKNLSVIAFVQDNLTNEVYQVTTTDTSAVPTVPVPPLSDDELITFEQELKFKLFPNPANNNLTLLFNKKVKDAQVQFVDISGKVLDSFQFADSIEFATFDLSYPSGMYYVRIISNEKIMTDKLIINK